MEPRSDSLQHNSPGKRNEFLISKKGLIVSDDPGESDFDQHGHGLIFVLFSIRPAWLNLGKPVMLYQSLEAFRLCPMKHVRHPHRKGKITICGVEIFNRLLVNKIFDVNVLLENTRSHTRMRITRSTYLGHGRQVQSGSATNWDQCREQKRQSVKGVDKQ